MFFNYSKFHLSVYKCHVCDIGPGGNFNRQVTGGCHFDV